ncbi:MAG: proline dehydrogenase family protein, partial [Thermodesulfovibrionia bacterium]|nr:proline dehydrogenase family protein [Thermodesulfovibrionia bacterium]
MNTHQDLENQIRNIGAEIYSSVKGEVPSIFDKKRWMGEVIEWAMQDDDFKVQLLRFIDVLPSLRTDALVVRILKEYFADERITPMTIKWGIKGISEKGIIPKIAGEIIKSHVESLARQFIAGRDPKDAFSALQTLRSEGVAFSVDLLGEVVVSDKEAREYTESYVRLLDFLYPEVMKWQEVPLLDRDNNGSIPKLNISFKVSSFYSQFDPLDWHGSLEKTKDGLRPIFKKAQDLGASITFD